MSNVEPEPEEGTEVDTEGMGAADDDESEGGQED
jgi:hypothetical protein